MPGREGNYIPFRETILFLELLIAKEDPVGPDQFSKWGKRYFITRHLFMVKFGGFHL